MKVAEEIQRRERIEVRRRGKEAKKDEWREAEEE